MRVVDILYEDGYLIGRTVGQKPYLLRIEPTAKARRAVRQWPVEGEELYDRLLQALDERIAAEPDEHKRGRLQRARDALADVGCGVISSVIVEAMKVGAGISG